jgi:hypothetical protein
MAGQVRIRLQTDHFEVEEQIQQGAVANIYPAEPGPGGQAQERAHRGVAIPTDRKSWQVVSLDPGRYLVEAVLPSGDIASDEITVGEGQRVDVDLKAGDAPHEWLSWQHLLGNVSDRGAYPTGIETTARPPQAYWVAAQPQHPGEGRAEVWMWPLLAEERGLSVHALAERLAGTPPTPITPVMEDPAVQLYRVAGEGPLFGWAAPAADGGPTEQRRYLLVDTEQGVEVASIPAPWVNVETGEQATIEVLVRKQPAKGQAAVSVTVRDPTLGSAVGYMTLGALPTAKRFFDLARELLYYKMTNPVAAAGGGYVLLATEHGSDAKVWHSWIENLRNWLEWLPDGAVQHGWLRLRHGRSDTDLEAARDALFTAYQRGVPLYSAGLQWLLDGLTVFASDDPQAQGMLEQVRRVAWRASVQEPFTVVHLPAA